MKHKIEKIIEKEDGRVFTVSRGNVPSVNLPQEVIEDLVAKGMDREAADSIKTKGISVRIMRAPRLETDVAISPATENLINQLKNKK